MRIFLHQDDKTFGPYSLPDIRRLLESESVNLSAVASYDGHAERVLLSSVPGVTQTKPSRRQSRPSRFDDQSTAKPLRKRRPVGCCGWIVLGVFALVVISIVGGLIVGDSGRWDNSRMAEGILTIKASPVDRPHSIADDIAKKVYDVAKDHPELHRLVINVDFYPTLMTDKYGNEAKGPLRMGTLTVDDLNEVRRYTIDGAYMQATEPSFTAEVQNMDYVESLSM